MVHGVFLLNTGTLNRMEFLYKPAFYAHILSSICILIAIILFIINYRKIIRLDSLELIKMFSILAIGIAAHGEGHITLEKEYGYDPIRMIRGDRI